MRAGGISPAPTPEIVFTGLAEGCTGPAGKPRILLAEDSEINRRVGFLMLERLGHEITMVYDGMEALKAQMANPFDLIFMDCMMPEMDGYASTRAIREWEKTNPGRVPIVACTANVTRGEIGKCLAAGMDDFLAKPYMLGNLRKMVEKWAKPGYLAPVG
jgi:two-component system sensor histidine kinase/response regulator